LSVFRSGKRKSQERNFLISLTGFWASWLGTAYYLIIKQNLLG